VHPRAGSVQQGHRPIQRISTWNLKMKQICSIFGPTDVSLLTPRPHTGNRTSNFKQFKTDCEHAHAFFFFFVLLFVVFCFLACLSCEMRMLRVSVSVRACSGRPWSFFPRRSECLSPSHHSFSFIFSYFRVKKRRACGLTWATPRHRKKKKKKKKNHLFFFFFFFFRQIFHFRPPAFF
jgi:hypothetical protein